MRLSAFLALALSLAPAQALAQRPHLLAEVPLADDTTEADVHSRLGEPAERRGQWVRYRLVSGSDLHIMYAAIAPHRIVYADLYAPGRRVGDRLFGTNEEIAAREVGQIDPCATEAGMVVPIWGWPTYEEGQPVTARVYWMGDGTQVRLGPPDAMQGINIVNPRDGAVIRRILPRNCPHRARVPTPPRSPQGRPESVDPFIPPRLIEDIALSPALTATDVEMVWGTPRPYGIEPHNYLLASGEQLTLYFSPVAPFGLVYADLVPAEGQGAIRRLFANNPRAATRSLDQIGPCPPFLRSLYDLWGPPDSSSGSAFVHATYAMANGDEVTFSGSNDPFGTLIAHPSGATERIRCPPLR